MVILWVASLNRSSESTVRLCVRHYIARKYWTVYRLGKMALLSKFNSRRCCPWSSKAALIVLIWNWIVSLGISSFLDPGWLNTNNTTGFYILSNIVTALYGFGTLLYLFYPLAGCLADIRWGRHKTVINSLRFVCCSFLTIVLLGSLIVIGFVPLMINTPL